jgi:hypothetical protein
VIYEYHTAAQDIINATLLFQLSIAPEEWTVGQSRVRCKPLSLYIWHGFLKFSFIVKLNRRILYVWIFRGQTAIFHVGVRVYDSLYDPPTWC